MAGGKPVSSTGNHSHTFTACGESGALRVGSTTSRVATPTPNGPPADCAAAWGARAAKMPARHTMEEMCMSRTVD